MEKRTILVVDDDQNLRDLIRINLEYEGFKVLTATNGVECIATVREQRPDMILLDIMMPEMDGLEACRRIRQFSQLPILMLTAKVQSNDIITGLDHGADDYLAKPFDIDELAARIRALLRRVPPSYRPLTAGKGEVTIDQQAREVMVRGELIDLTPTEYHLLIILAEKAGTVVDHETLLRAVWGQEFSRDNDYLKVYIWHLRRKLEQDPRKPRLLLTEWGVGYRLMA
ncbi:response regulator transcription factor [Candidatus Chloroploca sp. M-50]|uniref:Response regulator transcription factor n=1 Tax=Candidatus Chloroploca mongolica TaxID=2528176 RepID=A0ABS4D7T4_9CHLR|nr:response regulator transcription factor [Candidatus Chloroploca mongolica]MBP1465470.1 response regulator transcription factor [Candidatus Chloroploca mongolica]